ncbi:hypothetical protein FQR65_LT01056 [Abscondita terminalis]|nr:hypothetical protein FQR65_LT01056 [Abscondita terminalis]
MDFEKSLCSSNYIKSKKTWSRQQCPKYGVVTTMQGGRLGNQMWEYASVWAVARRTGLEPYIPRCIRIKLDQVFDSLSVPTFEEIAHCPVDMSTFVRSLDAWNYTYQSIVLPRHLVQPEIVLQWVQDIIQEFSFKKKLLNKSQNILRLVAKNNSQCIFVGVHVRRTDYISYLSRKYSMLPANTSYYYGAMKYFEEKYTNVIFIIVSDDPAWCIKKFSKKRNVYITSVATTTRDPHFHPDSNYGRIQRYKRDVACGPGEYQCKSGDCVANGVVCDGKIDCKDESDESDCAKRGSCLVPNNPAYGEYKIGDSSLKPGDYAPVFSALLTNCKNGYKVNALLKTNYPLCMNGKWSSAPPACERACPSVSSTATTIVKCKHQGVLLKNCEDPVENTIATLSCEPLFEEPGITNNPIRVCKEGSWSYPFPQCLPICGQKRPQQVTDVVGGDIAKKNDFPWHVGIYETSDKYLCAGSIISLTVVLSAAHCFCDPKGNKFPVENYKIAAGKYYRAFNDERDSATINFIHIPERYKGIINNYEADIAVVILQTPFKISTAVQPVCLDRTTEFENKQLSENNVGIVVGWGYVDYDENLSDELKEIHVPFRSYGDCYEKVTPDFRKFLTYDKLCAGYLYENKAVCQGDSGGGLTFAWNQNRYYIRGIVSTSPTTATSDVTTCGAETYGTYTLISKYIDFITEAENVKNEVYRPAAILNARASEVKRGQLIAKELINSPPFLFTPVCCSCLFPNNPGNGEYKIGTSGLKPGNYAPSFSRITINCNNGYKINALNSSICFNGSWILELPTCTRKDTCPSVLSTPNTIVKCKYEEVQLDNCEDPVENTTATVTCDPWYELPTKNPVRVCKDGSWSYPFTRCVPICGQKPPSSAPNVVVDVGKKTDYPWHVGIYDANDKYLCGGTILSLDVVFSAAHCFCDLNGNLYNVENYKIAAGKYYSSFNDERDRNTQTSLIKDIQISDRYKGSLHNFKADIAIIFLQTPLKMSMFVLPVCAPTIENMLHWQNNVGVVVGWGHKNGEKSDELREIRVPFISFEDCYDKVTPPFRKFLTNDKICAGYVSNNETVYQGDGGGGVTFVWKNNRYYLIGIVSAFSFLDPSAEKYRPYTSILDYVGLNRTGQFECKSGECVIEDAQCDGQIDCTDESDESDCADIRCAGNLFQCAYGACIRKNLMCDGKPDCKDNSDETSATCKFLVTSKAPPTCRTGEFKCNSGQCIDEEFLCDGKADCSDGSDETVKECSNIPCTPQYFFRCDYGACLNKMVRCNGTKECVDGSDEKNCNGKVTPIIPTKPTTLKPPTKPPTPTKQPTSGPPVPGSCLVPNNPAYGEYKIGDSSLKPGDYAPVFSALLTNCKNGYKVNALLKTNYPLCMNGKWSSAPPACERACPSVSSTATTIVKCKHQGVLLKNCEDPVENTIATLSCEPLFEEPGITNNPIRVCKEGSWSYPFPQCLPICGQKRPQGVTNIIGGQIAKENDYPWHVGIYETNDKYLCGGSVINLKVVLSAAHCFCDPKGNKFPVENYKIAAGKYYRAFNDERDSATVQESLINFIHIPERYKGIINNYEADIAVVILQTPFKISTAVQPVCLDRTTEFENKQLSENNVGIVVGWGYVDYDENLSDELKEIHVPFRSYADCYEKVTPDFRKFLTYDKICAGYLYENKAVCQGDSGGGLTFAWNQNRYYIRGIVSTSPSTSTTGVTTCDAERYGAYTLISKYMDFVTEAEIVS